MVLESIIIQKLLSDEVSKYVTTTTPLLLLQYCTMGVQGEFVYSELENACRENNNPHK